jgi:hypothetical protein
VQDTLPVLVFSLPAVCYCDLSLVYISAHHTKCHFGDQIKKTEMSGACSTNGERRDVYRVLVGKPEGKSTLARPRRRWEYNIKMDFQEVGLGQRELD